MREDKEEFDVRSNPPRRRLRRSCGVHGCSTRRTIPPKRPSARGASSSTSARSTGGAHLPRRPERHADSRSIFQGFCRVSPGTRRVLLTCSSQQASWSHDCFPRNKMQRPLALRGCARRSNLLIPLATLDGDPNHSDFFLPVPYCSREKQRPRGPHRTWRSLAAQPELDAGNRLRNRQTPDEGREQPRRTPRSQR